MNGVNDTYILEGIPGWAYLTLALIAFTAYHFIPRNVTPTEREGTYKLFGTLGPGPVLVFLIRFFGTDHLIFACLIVAVTHDIVPPYEWLAYLLLATEFLVASCAVTVSFVIYKARKQQLEVEADEKGD